MKANVIQSIVTSYASFIIDHTAHILIHSINTRPDSLLLWKRVLSTLHSAFEHDQDGTVQPLSPIP